MNTLKHKILLLSAAGVILLIAGCRQSEIGYYNPADNAVRFPGLISDTLYRNYSNNLFSLWFSFLSGNPMDEYADIEVPVIHMGIPPVNDIPVNVTVVQDENNAATGQYELLGGKIPAGATKGAVLLRVFNDGVLDSITRQLHLIINATTDYKCGPDDMINAVVYWNNTVTAPATTNAIRTYNFMIQSSLAYTSTSLANYSPRAHKVILAATGWQELPSYTVIYAGNLYLGYARMVDAYITDYNAAHPDDPLIHDAGGLIGTPIQARKY